MIKKNKAAIIAIVAAALAAGTEALIEWLTGIL